MTGRLVTGQSLTMSVELLPAFLVVMNTTYPGTPKPSYITPWDEMAAWEQAAVQKLFTHVRAVILPGLQSGITLSHEHGGYLVCSIWNALMFELLHDPKPSYVKHFDQLDEWQQKTDIKMFEAIEAVVRQELA